MSQKTFSPQMSPILTDLLGQKIISVSVLPEPKVRHILSFKMSTKNLWDCQNVNKKKPVWLNSWSLRNILPGTRISVSRCMILPANGNSTIYASVHLRWSPALKQKWNTSCSKNNRDKYVLSRMYVSGCWRVSSSSNRSATRHTAMYHNWPSALRRLP